MKFISLRVSAMVTYGGDNENQGYEFSEILADVRDVREMEEELHIIGIDGYMKEMEYERLVKQVKDFVKEKWA